MAAPVTLLVLFGAKSLFKVVAVYPAVRIHKYDGNAGAYYTLMMSTGLTFGTISALFGLSHQIITQAQYSYIVGTVIASAVIPTMILSSPPSSSPLASRQESRTGDYAASTRVNNQATLDLLDRYGIPHQYKQLNGAHSFVFARRFLASVFPLLFR
jgi:Kef-type K+ transport system membrane component KefB